MIIGQINGTYKAKEERMKKYLEKVLRLVKKFKKTDFIQIPREENMEANTLVNEASTNEVMYEFDEIQYIPSIDIPEVQQVESRGNWMTPIISYLKKDDFQKKKTRLESLESDRPGTSSWTRCYIKEAFLSLILGVWLQMRRTMC